jgi:hypothetical protein
MNKLFISLSFVFFASIFSSCNKDCYNPNLEAEYENKLCPTDCPGVIGCDGKEYCNECMANKMGVAVEN